MRAVAGADLIQQLDRALFEEPSANAAEHIFARVPLQDDIVDAIGMQQLAEQQSRRSRANDCYFGPQYLLLPIL